MKLGQIIAIALAAYGTLPAHAEPAPLKLEGNFHFTAGYKDHSCLTNIVIKAVRDSQTSEVTELDVYAAQNPEHPAYTIRNRGTVVSGSYKTIESVTDSDAESREYYYDYGIRTLNNHVHFRVVQTWFNGEELRSYNGEDLCNYARD